jgi:hypothetical protein
MAEDDLAAIRAVLARQFRALQWEPGRPADWNEFRSTFFADTTFVPAARPAQRRSVEEFIARMQRLEADGKLKTFHETMLGTTIQLFGNVAVALGACEMLENGEEVTRDVGAFLFVKDGGKWWIAGQAWDLETDANPIPAHLRKPEA